MTPQPRPTGAEVGVEVPPALGPAGGRRFEAIVLDGDRLPDPARHSDGRIAAGLRDLLDAGVHVIVAGAGPGEPPVVPDPPDGPGLVRSGPRRLTWAAEWLAERGITGSLVLVCGEDLDRDGIPELARAVVLPASPGADLLAAVIDDQLARRRERRVPDIDEDPAWVVRLPTDPMLGRVRESLGTVANGWTGTRGAVEEDGPLTLPLFVVNGIYDTGRADQLMPGPMWTALHVPGEPESGEQLLDLRTGVLRRERADGLRTLRFASAAAPDVLALRAELDGPGLEPAPITPPDGELATTTATPEPGTQIATTTSASGARITVATRDLVVPAGRGTVIERVAVWDAAATPTAPPDLSERLRAVAATGLDRLLAEHRAAWAALWRDACVTIEGAPEDELAARFAVFHLLTSAPDRDEAAVGARGLSGTAYGGHVFWDADVFVLPVLAALRPAAARAMLEYRLRRLGVAQAAARREGGAGARFPWESAATGVDVTPTSMRLPGGPLVPIRTGQHEEHIVADVAWAACEYAAWTGDEAFLTGPGHLLVVETARWWASRVRLDREGRGHLYGVIGPDEYHEIVDDSAYTNVMARWNLRRAADLCDATGTATEGEIARWRELAEALVDGYDPTTGRYEQFSGYWRLEPLLVRDVAEPPIAADVVLGRERVAGSQLIKQADVLMLHHLVPHEVAPGSLEPNLDYYEPRTAHGSSLSPAISAACFARAGRTEEALDRFRLAARLDLDDLTGTTAGGLHIATMGGLWQALAYGFLGLRPTAEALEVDPHLPEEWRALELRLSFHGQVVTVRATHDELQVRCGAPLVLRVAGGPPARCQPPGTSLPLRGSP